MKASYILALVGVVALLAAPGFVPTTWCIC